MNIRAFWFDKRRVYFYNNKEIKLRRGQKTAPKVYAARGRLSLRQKDGAVFSAVAFGRLSFLAKNENADFWTDCKTSG